MNLNKTLWEKGDFTRIAATIRDSGRVIIEGLNVRPGMQVLDLGCGDGTTARWRTGIGRPFSKFPKPGAASNSADAKCLDEHSCAFMVAGGAK